jgi:hypothetical protein
MLKSSFRLALGGVALSLAMTPVWAQSKKELVNRLLLLQQPAVEALARSIAERPAAQLAMSARQMLGNVPAEKREAAVKAIDAGLKKYADEAMPLLRERAIKLAPGVLGSELETNFNEQELKELLTWFESPVVKRFQQLSPGIERSLTEKLVGETRTQIEPKIKVLEALMAKELGLPSKPEPASATPGMPGNRSSAK